MPLAFSCVCKRFMTCLPWVYRCARAWPARLEVCTAATNAHQLCAVNLTYFYLTLLTRTVAVSLGYVDLFKINAYTNCKISWCFRRFQQICYCCQWFTNNRRRMVTSVLSVVADSLCSACHWPLVACVRGSGHVCHGSIDTQGRDQPVSRCALQQRMRTNCVLSI